ncbi:MAG: molybdenum cofactor biosynthesis protein MoaE [Caldilineaceae bacterium]|nr:molybdenum cofactor biosynthesis protein MoaE [Caldilineaceae bacterium]MCB9137368.1 molybdenum cofactor biosynthesis protein MoaE [Caldilineaceae bacterium]
MEIHVKLFATLRQQAGWAEKTLALPAGATVAAVLDELATLAPDADLRDRPLYAALNREYADLGAELTDGDTLALFPPVSGGGDEPLNAYFLITEEPLSLDDAAARVSRPDCGAVATFAGIVRGETAVDEDVRGTDFLNYEAYAEMAEAKLAAIGDEIRVKWPAVKAVSILHRIGRLEIGEPSVVIAVATPHRGDGCFEACRYAIERLKAIVPIWKEENWSDGQVWVEGPRQPDLDLFPPAE